jgi:hypothetical protein
MQHLAHVFFAAVTRFLPKAENPNFMATMCFSEDTTVPYTTTTYSRTRLVGMDEGGSYYRTTHYDPPLVDRKEYDATKYSWREAQRVNSGDGPRYEIHNCTKQVPGWKCDADREDRRVSGEGGKTLFTKAEAINMLSEFEASSARIRTIEADAKYTRKHFSRYKPS